MKTLEFSTTIEASRDKVWRVLWNDTTFRDWAGLIDEGTYIKGELKAGEQVEFLSTNSGYRVTSYVEIFSPPSQAVFKHKSDTQDLGSSLRAAEWAGGREEYLLEEVNNKTKLTIISDTPADLVGLFREKLPRVLARIKQFVQN